MAAAMENTRNHGMRRLGSTGRNSKRNGILILFIIPLQEKKLSH